MGLPTVPAEIVEVSEELIRLTPELRDTLRDAGIEPVPLDRFAVWVAKLKPMIQ